MLRLKTFLLFLIFISGKFSVLACGNEFYRTSIPFYNKKLVLDHLINRSKENWPYWMHGFGGDGLRAEYYELMTKMEAAGFSSANRWKITWEEIQTALKKNIDYKLLSDFAWHELRIGNKENAVKLLEALYAKHPNEYNVLANLGTAYEVTGDNQQALTLLRKAVAVNPQSHYGSEWIHIKILEQKVKTKPEYKLILDLKADQNTSAWLKGKVYDKVIKPDSLMVQLAYQLHERISFVDAPDPVVAQLVKDFADLVALTHSKKEAKDFYNYALRYDTTVLKIKPPVVEVNIASNNIIKKEEVKKTSAKGLYIVAAVIGIIAIVLVMIRRKNKTIR